LINEYKLTDAVLLTGKQPFTVIPQFIANFYISIVSAASADGFHYSPLKLREYLAVGSATIAPRAGDLTALFKDGTDLLFYSAGDETDLADKMVLLLEDQSLHDRIVKNAIKISEEGTWLHELRRIAEILNIDQ
jgi:glycosyltransferase involved in cell wall biosynthesis